VETGVGLGEFAGLILRWSGKMLFKGSCICAVAALCCASLSASGAIIKTAKHASTSNTTVKTTTSGQQSILMNVDPLNVAAFQLDVSFEANKVEFAGLHGLNGYIIDFFSFSTQGNSGQILDIHGYYPGFNDRIGAVGADGSQAAPVPPPPAGEVDIFQLTFLDNAPGVPKTFKVFATDNNDYITAFNTDTGELTPAVGPYNPQTDQGVDGAISTVDAAPAAPIPPAWAMGLIGGAGVVANAVWRRRRA
jgi:hypothetical protein